MTASAKCGICGKITGVHNAALRAWICSEPCLNRFWEEQKALDDRFDSLVKTGAISIDEARSSADERVYFARSESSSGKAEVVRAAEHFEKMVGFRDMMARSFRSGIADGVSAYRKELAKLGPMYGKALKIGDRILEVIRRAP